MPVKRYNFKFMKKSLGGVLLLLMLSVDLLYGQIKQADSIFHYKPKPFTPPVEAVIKGMIYSPAQVFIASDIYGHKHNLASYRGKYVLMWFLDKDCVLCEEGLGMLDSIKTKYGDRIVVFAFFNDSKQQLLDRLKGKKPLYYPMYNSKIFGEMMYAGSLSYPRMFLIDRQGFIIKILPAEFFKSNPDYKKSVIQILDEATSK